MAARGRGKRREIRASLSAMSAHWDFDLFVIGAGSGGVASGRRAAALGARVGLCEAGRVGGTCVLRGCVPKKLLMMGTAFAHDITDAFGFGWSVQATLDWGRLMAAKNAELARLEKIYEGMLDRAGVEVLRGRGRLVDGHTVEVGERRIRARNILIATGGRPRSPPVPGVELAIDSDAALDLPTLPQGLLVVGGGYVAVELASIFSAAGVEVQILVRGDEILTGFDTDVRRALAEQLEARGITIHRRTPLRSIERRAEGRLVVRTEQGTEHRGDAVLMATGRSPNTEGLGLEAAGIAFDEGGAIVVDAWSATSCPSIYAIGDVTRRPNLTPVAIADGRALAQNLFGGGEKRPVAHDLVATAVFSQPPVAAVGLSEDQARERDVPHRIYEARFRAMKDVLSGRPVRVLVKLVVHAETDRILGVHWVGPDGPEIMQGFAAAMTAGATKADFDRTIAIHPTLAEELVLLREPAPR